MQTIEHKPEVKPLSQEQHEFVEAIIISGPQKGRVIQLNGEEVVNAVTPVEKQAINELLGIYNDYLSNEDAPGATQHALDRIKHLREKYRGMA